jgi:hypothetical protein
MKFNIPKNLLTIGDAKTSKGEKLGFKTAILYMSPHNQNESGVNLCPFATKGCSAACLYTAGRGKFSNVKAARINKSHYFINAQITFLNQVVKEIAKLSKKYGTTLAVRLNGTTDVRYSKLKIEGKNIFELFPHVRFYDYAKNPNIVTDSLNYKNYSVTFSRAEEVKNQKVAKDFFTQGTANVATVLSVNLYKSIFASDDIAEVNFGGLNFVNGDLSDLRFLDSSNSLVCLKAKGDAKKDTSGFVIQTMDQLLREFK